MSQQEPVVFGGRYELHRRLARGGMAEVFLARDQLLDRPVAVKVLFAQYAADPAFVERFRREAQSAANLNHPNIVGVYDWGEESGTYYIVMEYVAGRSLADVLRQEGTLLPERAADIGIDIAAALGFTHRNGVVHRDIKPGNVLLSSDGAVKVTDFGIARAISSTEENLTQAGLVMGTATYFSPEQAQGKNVDPRSDVYSLGIVLFEMVVGRPPFKGEDALAVAYQHVQEQPTPPSQLNSSIEPALEAIILQSLAKNPSNRYPSAEDLRADLRRYRQGHQIEADAASRGPAVAAAAGNQGPDTGQYPVEATRAVPATQANVAADQYYEEYSPPVFAPDDYGYEETPRRNGLFLLVLLLLLAVVGGGLYLLADTLGVFGDDAASSTDSGDSVEVPDVSGLSQTDAENQLIALGFEVTPEFENDPSVPAMQVIRQDPAALSEQERGSTITIVVSSGAELFPVPDVTNRTEQDARSVLSEAGFEDIVTEGVASASVDTGLVVEQNPAADAEVPATQQITLKVSQGPEERIVQDVAGQTVDGAEGILRNQGFKISQREEFSDRIDKGRVIRTNPSAGTVQPDGATIELVVSAGVEQIIVPNVVEKTEETAKAELSTANFGFEVVERALPPGSPDNGRVLEQTPVGGTRANKGAIVTITVGRAALLPTTTTTSTTTTTTDPNFDTGD